MMLNENKLQVSLRGKIRFIKLEEILFAQCNGAKTQIHTLANDGFWLAKPLKDLEALLLSHSFARVNHNTLVNLIHVTELHFQPKKLLILNSTIQVKVSQRKYPHIRQLLTEP